MTLHEAIEKVLRREGKPLKATELAEIINREQLYVRIDKEPLKQNHISARISNYRDVFELDGKGKIRLSAKNQANYKGFVKSLWEFVGGHIDTKQNAQFIIAVVLFGMRKAYTGQKSFRELFNKIKNGQNPKELFEVYLEQAIKDAISPNIITSSYRYVSSVFEPVKGYQLEGLISVVYEYEDVINLLSDEEFGSIFNSILQQNGFESSINRDFVTPALVSQLIKYLSDIQQGESVFDPFAGTAGMFVEGHYPLETALVLNEIDAVKTWLGAFNLSLTGFNNFSFFNTDTFIDHVATKYDWVITHPPFLERPVLEYNESTGDFNSSNRSHGGADTVSMILKRLKSNGKAIVVLPENFYYSHNKHLVEMRKFLVENRMIQSVVALPQGAFRPYTGIATSVIVIDAGGTQNVQFVDLSKTYTGYEDANSQLIDFDALFTDTAISSTVDYQFIRKEGYALIANRYTNSEVVGSEKEGYVTLKDLVVKSVRCRAYKNIISDSNAIPYTRVSDLSADNNDFILNINNATAFVDDTECANDIEKIVSADSDIILVSRIGERLKPTLLRKGTKSVFNYNILGLAIDVSKVDPVYLILQLRSDYVKTQLNRYRTGTAQAFTKIDELLSIKVKLPPLEEQVRIAKEYLVARGQSAHSGSKEELDGTAILNLIKHEYDNVMNGFNEDWKSLKRFLTQLDSTKGIFSLAAHTSGRVGSRTANEVIDTISNKVKVLRALFTDVADIVKIEEKGGIIALEETELVGFIQGMVNELEADYENVKINIKSYKDEEVMQMINKNLFRIIIRNFIKNTSIHGSENGKQVLATIVITKPTKENHNVIIDMHNDGKPMPLGFSLKDFVSYGQRKGDTRGNGLGGYLMNKAVQYHGGTLSLISNGNEKFQEIYRLTVHFRIELPKQ